MEPKDSNTPNYTVPQPATGGLVGDSSAAVPITAGDGDLIEKEWVEAAKRIIEDNKQDPYMQSRALTALREDYMRKRYGKEIKAAE